MSDVYLINLINTGLPVERSNQRNSLVYINMSLHFKQYFWTIHIHQCNLLKSIKTECMKHRKKNQIMQSVTLWNQS